VRVATLDRTCSVCVPVRPSVCLSVCPFALFHYCVGQRARFFTVRSALDDRSLEHRPAGRSGQRLGAILSAPPVRTPGSNFHNFHHIHRPPQPSWEQLISTMKTHALNCHESTQCKRTKFAITQGEMTSQNLRSRYVRHFVGITWHNVRR